MDDDPIREHLARIEAKIEAALAFKGRYVLTGAKTICAALGVSPRTLYRWRLDVENPLRCAHLGHGLATTPTLIDEWVRHKWELEEKRRQSRPKTRQYDRFKQKIVARVGVPEDEGEGSNVSPPDFPLDSVPDTL
ncbi:MAG: hypothetical protein HYY11_01835 [Candidatus Methylomirabilis oxyfera]|nr:hypothetical protein [Candidatus Methylomirabilis oxyfera]